MSKAFAAYDITQFLDESIGTFVDDIWDKVVDMANEDDKDERLYLKTQIEYLVEQCKDVIR